MQENKPTVRLTAWHISGAHVYGKDFDTKKFVRSTRLKELQKKDFVDNYSHGDVLVGHSTTYQLIGARKRQPNE